MNPDVDLWARVLALERYTHDLEERVKETFDHSKSATEHILKALRAIQNVLRLEVEQEKEERK